jgi:hypothetical protein
MPQLHGVTDVNVCSTSGGVVVQARAALNAVNPNIMKSVCHCPPGLEYYAPAGGCVQPGRGQLPQRQQPARRMN